jgi:hypothetical protein
VNYVTIAAENIYKGRPKIIYSPSLKKFLRHRNEENLWKSVSVGEKPVSLPILHHRSPQEIPWDRNGSSAMIGRHLTALSQGKTVTIGSNWLRGDTYTHITYSKVFHNQERHSNELILPKTSRMDRELLWCSHKYRNLPASYCVFSALPRL